MSINLIDAHQQFVENLKKQGKASATVIAYSKDIEQLVEHVKQSGKLLPNEVDAEDIDNFKETLKRRRYTSKSISRKVNSIKAFFRFLFSQGEVDKNPAEEIIHPKVEQSSPRVLSRLEYRALRDACRGDARVAAIVEVLLQTGMRISELANLKLVDLDLERGVINIEAQNSRGPRKVPLNNAAKNALMDYLKVRPRAREKTVFLTKTCRPFLVRNIRTAIDRYFRLAGIKLAKVNDLRHTFIVEQLKAGTPLIYVSQLVGHKRITTTEKYLQLLQDDKGENPKVQIEEL